MTRNIALTALTTLGSSCEPFHEPFHDRPQRALRSVTIRRASSASRAADNGGAPSSLRAQNRSVSHVMACPCFGQDYCRTCRWASVARPYSLHLPACRGYRRRRHSSICRSCRARLTPIRVLSSEPAEGDAACPEDPFWCGWYAWSAHRGPLIASASWVRDLIWSLR